MEIEISKKKLTIIIVVIGILGIFGLQALLTSSKTEANSKTNSETLSGNVEKIQVVHFHSTNQCWSCITLGEYAEATVKEKFPDEYANGLIEFKEINVDLLQNAEIVKKFDAQGSALFINVVIEGKDNISEDVYVWRLLSNQKFFEDYLENKLRDYL